MAEDQTKRILEIRQSQHTEISEHLRALGSDDSLRIRDLILMTATNKNRHDIAEGRWDHSPPC